MGSWWASVRVRRVRAGRFWVSGCVGDGDDGVCGSEDRPRSKQGNTTNLDIFSMENEKELLRWDSNPRHTAYEAAALPAELPRQLLAGSNQGNTRQGQPV